MNAFTSQFSLPLRIKKVRDAGEQSAKQHLYAISPYAMEYLEQCLAEFAASGQPFSSDDVWATMSPTMRTTVERAGNAVGAVFSHAAKRGLIRRTGQMIPSHRIGARGRRVAEWRGVRTEP